MESALWKSKKRDQLQRDVFLYDVTSSYFEGIKNLLSAFGYNRDGKKGKKQIVIGLLTDKEGDPCSIRVYSGETRDFNTVSDALEAIHQQFECRNVILVGDRGMIKNAQIKQIKDAKHYYISSLTKPQINKLITNQVFEMELFDEALAEVIDGQTQERYILRRNPSRAEQMKSNRQERLEKFEQLLKRSTTYLREGPRTQPEVQMRELRVWIEKLKLKKWLKIGRKDGQRTIEIEIDQEALDEEQKLDGCYVIRTNVQEQDHSASQVHERYKDLSKVEQDFRTMKTAHLELRPIHVTTENNTRAHALIVMLELKIRRYLQKAWSGLELTVEEGLRELESLSIVRIEDKASGECREILLRPTEMQAQLLRQAGVSLPKSVPEVVGAAVVTRKQLSSKRKDA